MLVYDGDTRMHELTSAYRGTRTTVRARISPTSAAPAASCPQTATPVPRSPALRRIWGLNR
eukprot:2004440-Rhodomonas_salina.2